MMKTPRIFPLVSMIGLGLPLGCGTDSGTNSGTEDGNGGELGSGGQWATAGESSTSGAPSTGGISNAGGGMVNTSGTGGMANSAGGTSGGPGEDEPTYLIESVQTVPEALRNALLAAENMTAESLTETYPPPANAALSYDATSASGFDTIQASALALDQGETARLASDGLVISTRQQFPSFAYGYKTIYGEDLPVYVSADSILEAVHRTFDSLLSAVEQGILIDELARLLSSMRARLPGRYDSEQLTADVDLYLTVAESLLRRRELMPAASADPTDVSTLYSAALNATGHAGVSLFGSVRDEDFSQFTPRGHYTATEALSNYFKSMMWLGRVDFRIIETQGDGKQVFRRRQFEAAVALRELMGESEVALWSDIDATIGSFVGERDSMSPSQLGDLMDELGITSLAEAEDLSDETIVAAFQSGDWGAQRIASRIIYKEAGAPKTLPLDRSFLLFGQRYTVDSHAFVNVTFDRVENRMMPSPLDAAFAALGNNAGLPILSSEFDKASYVHGLARTRMLVDAHEPEYWEGSFYTRWLGALRSLSSDAQADLGGIPETEGWHRRILGTQLGSWAELRHDTILYAKQSYTTGTTCEFPDAYVDPYPQFYARLGELADTMSNLADGLPASVPSLKTAMANWASNFGAVTANLRTMAENQLTGAPHSRELIDFINDAVKWDEEQVCGSVSYTNLSGWYLRLYMDPISGITYDPTIADVHTQPTDEGGNDKGRILHVGTGMPRLMVVTAETCEGPRAYAGLAFSYGERITEGWKRLDDEEWAKEIASAPFPDPAWMSPVFAK